MPGSRTADARMSLKRHLADLDLVFGPDEADDDDLEPVHRAVGRAGEDTDSTSRQETLMRIDK